MNNNFISLIENSIECMRSNKQQKCIDILNQLSKYDGFDVDMMYTCMLNSFIGNRSLLMQASYYGCLDVVKHLIEVMHANPNKQGSDGWTALHYASNWNNSKIINYLISVPCININIKTNRGWTALHCAAHWGYKAGVKSLLKSNNLDRSIRNSKGETAEKVAKNCGHCVISDMIYRYEPRLSVFSYNK